MYKAIIFDFFDVIHSDPYYRWLKKHGLERSGEFEESSQMLDRGQINDMEFYQRLGDLSGHSSESVKAVFDDTQLIDQDIVTLLKELRDQYKLGLLSNASGQYLRPILKEHGLIDLFDEVVVSAEVGIIKPDPAIFKHILDKLDVQASEAIFTDDNPHNVAAAESVGIHSIVFTSEKALRQELAAAGVKVS